MARVPVMIAIRYNASETDIRCLLYVSTKLSSSANIPQCLLFVVTEEINLTQIIHYSLNRNSTGSPVYAAPEVYLAATTGKPYTGPPAVMWSIGATLHAMLTCRLPYEVDEYQVCVEHSKDERK